jgi:RNA polymerase sigma-70 factor (ECF subfamily)
MNEVVRGTLTAQNTLATRLLARGRWLVGTILRHPSDVEDAVQTGVLEAFRAAKDYRGDGPLERWADRIFARIAVKDAQRYRKSREQNATIEDVELESPNQDMASSGAYEYIALLPAPCREAVLLRHMLEYTVPEIAVMTGVSENTVKDRLLRGRAMIRKRARQEDLIEKARSGS